MSVRIGNNIVASGSVGHSIKNSGGTILQDKPYLQFIGADVQDTTDSTVVTVNDINVFFGTEVPSDSSGSNGDVYFRIVTESEETKVESVYQKEDIWILKGEFGTGSGTWGSITGDIESQTDLMELVSFFVKSSDNSIKDVIALTKAEYEALTEKDEDTMYFIIDPNHHDIEVIDNLNSTSTVDALSANQGRILSEMISSSGSGGHTILNSEGTEMTQRSKLQFNGAELTDDATGDTTKVNTVGFRAITNEDIINPVYSEGYPVGSISLYAGNLGALPDGFYGCIGQEILKSTEPELYAVIGDKFGTASSSEYFKLPDFRDRVPVGVSDTDTDINDVGKTHGEKNVLHAHTTQSHVLTTSEIPAHSHTGSTNNTGGHRHTFTGWWTTRGDGSAAYACVSRSPGADAPEYGSFSTAGAHSHTVTTNNTGGGQAHDHGDTGSTSIDVSQPEIAMYFIIKARSKPNLNAYVENTLASTSTTNALSAAQGKALLDKINELEAKLAQIDGSTTVHFDKTGDV